MQVSRIEINFLNNRFIRKRYTGEIENFIIVHANTHDTYP